jgi:hypothetical protein
MAGPLPPQVLAPPHIMSPSFVHCTDTLEKVIDPIQPPLPAS